MSLLTEKWRLSTQTDPCNDQSNVIKYPTDVAALPNGNFVVADSELHRLFLLNGDDKRCRPLVATDLWPNAVAAHPKRDHVLASDRKHRQVNVYDVSNGTLIRSFRDEERMKRPHGVAIDSKGQIFVTDTKRHVILTFDDRGGKFVRQFGGQGKGVGDLHLPFYCAVNRKDQLIVSDNMNYSIKFFDNSGRYLSKIGSGQDWGARQFQCPYGLCCDGDDNLLVCDSDSNRVILFDGKGQFYKYLLTRVDGCSAPCGVAVSGTNGGGVGRGGGGGGRLVVTEASREGAAIKIFEYDPNSVVVQNLLWIRRD